MTEFDEFSSKGDSVQVSWKSPKYKPDHFKLFVKCKSDGSESFNYVRNETLSQHETALEFYDLPSRSICEFTLLAVYNPASRDPGITCKYYTESPGKKLIISGTKTFYAYSCFLNLALLCM